MKTERKTFLAAASVVASVLIAAALVFALIALRNSDAALVEAGKNNNLSAYGLAVKAGYNGTETEWLASLVGETGKDGKSAYDLAVENGYRGSVAEWLASLVGTNGTSGTVGLSAYDLAKITAYAMNNEMFRKIVSTKRYVLHRSSDVCGQVILNKNKLLSSFDGANGVKTGYTKKAGRCLVSSATRDDMTVIAVLTSQIPYPKRSFPFFLTG